MEKPFDMIVNELSENLMYVYQESKLPVSVANLVVQDFAKAINEATKVALDRQKQDYLSNLQKEKELNQQET